MPKNTVTSNPASRTSVRRSCSSSSKATSHHLSLPLSTPPAVEILPQSPAAWSSSTATCGSSSASLFPSASSPPSLACISSASFSAFSTGFEVSGTITAASSSFSSSLSSSSGISLSAVIEESSNSSSAPSLEESKQDVLYEYVKGLQEAIKGDDPEFAERLLGEIGASLASPSPSSVAVVISANGARLIASSIRHFRWHGIPSKVTCKGGKANASVKTAVLPRCTEQEEELQSGSDELDIIDGTEGHSMDQAAEVAAPLVPGCSSNESRRKRQRTAGELEEEDESLRDLTESSFVEHLSEPSSSTMANSIDGLDEVHNRASCKGLTNGLSETRLSSSERQRRSLRIKYRAEKVLQTQKTDASKEPGLSKQGTENHCEDGPLEESAKEHACICKCSILHKGCGDSCASHRANEKSISKTTAKNVVSGKEKRKPLEACGGFLRKCNCKCNRDEPRYGCKSETPEVDSKVDGRANKDISSNTVAKNAEVGENEANIYTLAKDAGLSDVVAAGCNALDRLLNAALQTKGVGAGSRAAGIIGSLGGKRGKFLSAEMYVALTEAFVETVQVWKDNVDLLSWCLNCLGSIVPPFGSEKTSSESTTGSVGSGVSGKESPKVVASETVKLKVNDNQLPLSGDQAVGDQRPAPSKAVQKLVCKYREHQNLMDVKGAVKSPSGSYVAAARSICSNRSNKGSLTPPSCGGFSSESTSSSISALAAVAYAATVPMLAEKAVRTVLSAMQSCDIESQSTLAALRALSAHLSSTNSKYVCDDAFAFIIAAMREFVSDVEMQAESCIALASLTRAVSSNTGHAAWGAITISMDHHRQNLTVQRAGCGALQVLCTRTGLGIPDWGSSKRPLRAPKDTERETGVRALVSAMASFPQDVRIQWHGCSTLWTLVHSAGIKSVANMVKNGAVSAVVGAMSVCRMNETIQQEGCNVIGTMVRTLAESGHEIGLLMSASSSMESREAIYKSNDPEKNVLSADKRNNVSISTDDWWAALSAVVTAMKTFNKSKSLQSNGTFALGCILKGSGEPVHLGFANMTGISPQPGMPISNSKPAEVSSSGTCKPFDGYLEQASSVSCSDEDKVDMITSSTTDIPGKDVISDVEQIRAAVEVTMAAMQEFSKVEMVQVWGCAVLQQAFLAYVHYAKRLMPTAKDNGSTLPATLPHCIGQSGVQGSLNCKSIESDSLQPFQLGAATTDMDAQDPVACPLATSQSCIFNGVSFADDTISASKPGNFDHSDTSCSCLSRSSSLSSFDRQSWAIQSAGEESWSSNCASVDVSISDIFGASSVYDILASILLQASSAMCLISRTMLQTCSNSMASGVCQNQVRASPSQPAKSFSKLPIPKPPLRSQGASSSQYFTSVRQSWCAALGAIGDVFGHLTRNSDMEIAKTGLNQSDSVDALKSSKKFNNLSSECLRNNISAPKCAFHGTDDGGGHDTVIDPFSLWPYTIPSNKANLMQYTKDVKAYMDNVVQQYKERYSCISDDAKNPLGSCMKADKKTEPVCITDFGGVSEEVGKGLKAWQGPTEALTRIAEQVGFPSSVKKAILAIRAMISKLEDAETVTWACHALVSLYLTWENLHIFKPGIETDREEYKSKIWGEGEVGVRQLVDLVIHWTEHNRPDVTSLVLQALYGACMFAATVHEIEEVFSLDGGGAEAVVVAVQKALSSVGNSHQRRKVVQQGCFVLATVCGYSIRAQVAVAVKDGVDVILAALEKYDDDNQVQINGLHALGIDARLQTDFFALWNAASSRTAPNVGGKLSRKKRNNQAAGTVGLSHIFREGTGLTSPLQEPKLLDNNDLSKGRWSDEFRRLVLDEVVQMGLFRSALMVAPNCGGAVFAVDLLKNLNGDIWHVPCTVEMQAHICLIVAYMAEHDKKWCESFINSKGIGAILAAMGRVHSWRDDVFGTFALFHDGVEHELTFERNLVEDGHQINKSGVSSPIGKSLDGETSALKLNSLDHCLEDILDSRIQWAASWALAGLVKNCSGLLHEHVCVVIQALVVALYRYGGMLDWSSQCSRARSTHLEVCTAARLALARLGLIRIMAPDKTLCLIHEAAEAGDVTSLHALAKKGINVLLSDVHGHTGEWYAGKHGHLNAVQFFKEQAQLISKKKARERAKVKSKQNVRKSSPLIHEITRPPKNPQSNLGNDCSVVLSESITVDPSGASCAEGSYIPEAAAEEGKLRDTERANIEICKEESITIISLSGIAESAKEKVQEESPKEITLVDICPIEKICLNSTDENACLNLANATEREESDNESIKEINQGGTVDLDSVDDKAGKEGLQTELHEAMSSGDVNRMKEALEKCELSGSPVDSGLIKKVKGALAKRLKRKEKITSLEVELCAAMEASDTARIHAAILSIENVPRYAGVLQEKLEAAKTFVSETEKATEVQVSNSCVHLDTANTCIDGFTDLVNQTEEIVNPLPLDMVPDILSETKEGSPELWSSEIQQDVPKEMKDDFGKDDEAWTDICKGRRRKGKESADLSCSKETQSQISVSHGRGARKERGPRTRKNKSSNIRQEYLPSGEQINFNAESFSYAPSSQISNPQDLPPLLPTPSRIRLHGHACPSVIMPPRSHSQTGIGSAGHNPITPQLFPSSSSGLLSYAYSMEDSTRPNSPDDGISQLSSLLNSTTWALPCHTMANQESASDLWSHRAHLESQGVPMSSNSSGYLAAILATLFPPEKPASSSTTLFSSSLDGFPSPSIPDYIMPSMLHSHVSAPILNINAMPFSPAVARPLDHTLSSSPHLLSTNSEHVQEMNASVPTNYEFLRSSPFELSSLQTSLFSRENPCLLANRRTEGIPFKAATSADVSMQSRLQSALVEASLEDSCCICFDMPKDAALVPCGHRMCKGCAEEMRRIRQNCPICNRNIDTVLALYG